LDHFNLDEGETALICILLLRGPQTPGELRARTERMHGFTNLDEVTASLEDLGKVKTAGVAIASASGQKEKRYPIFVSRVVGWGKCRT
jgi:uncharacterized protein YceH (UPF0502 family)